MNFEVNPPLHFLPKTGQCICALLDGGVACRGLSGGVIDNQKRDQPRLMGFTRVRDYAEGAPGCGMKEHVARRWTPFALVAFVHSLFVFGLRSMGLMLTTPC